MTSYTMRYPGDPPDTVYEMNREKFLLEFPRVLMLIRDMSTSKVWPALESIPIGVDEIYCDFCNDDPGDTVFLWDHGHKAYCRNCFESNLARYCTREVTP